MVPLGQWASTLNSYPKWPTLFNCLHPMWDEVYHSAVTELMMAIVTSNHCGQHTRNHETANPSAPPWLPHHLKAHVCELLHGSFSPTISPANCKTYQRRSFLKASGDTCRQPAISPKKNAPELLKASLSRRQGDGWFLTVDTCESICWYSAFLWQL